MSRTPLSAVLNISCCTLVVSLMLAAGSRSHAEIPPDCLGSDARQASAGADFARAVELSRITLTRDPSCADAQYLRAYALLRLNQPKESLTAYTAAAKLRTPSAVDLRNVALDYSLLEDYRDARRWAQAALSSDKTDPESWYVLGRVEYSMSRMNDAANSFQQVLKLAPASVKAQNNLGLAYEGLNEPGEAIEAYHKAIQFGEDQGKPSEQPLMNLAIILSHRGDLDQALSLMLRAIAIAPQDADVCEHLGNIYLQKAELSKAQVQLEKAVKLKPSDARFHFLLGQVYRRSGMNDKSRAELSIAQSLDATHSTPNYTK